MKNLNIILSIILLYTTNSIFTARSSSRTSTQTKKRIPTKKPTRTPVERPQQPEEEERELIKYSDILVFLKEKAPNSSDFPTLLNIKTEVERQINYLESTIHEHN